MNKHLIAPSVLAADFMNLERDISMINQSEADWLHIDIMDGVFVPNISFGMEITKGLGKISQKPLDVHLMIVQPERYITDFKNVGAAVLTVHYEACTHLHRTLQEIQSQGMKAGIAVNPHTSVDLLHDVMENTDVVCLMSVNPGFGGQKFIYNTLKKIEKLKDYIIVHNLPTLIEIDGGVGLQNAEAILSAGADILVAGSSVFASANPIKTIADLKALRVHTL